MLGEDCLTRCRVEVPNHKHFGVLDDFAGVLA
jgi:hypothetical protein